MGNNNDPKNRAVVFNQAQQSPAAPTGAEPETATSRPVETSGVETKPQKASDPQPTSPESISPIPEEFLTDEDLYPDLEGEEKTKRLQKPPLPVLIGAGVAALLLLIVILVSVFKGNSKTTNSKVTLTYWGLWENESVMESIISAYEKTHTNVEINYVNMDAKDKYIDRIIERTKNGNGPDIFRYHNTWVSELSLVLSGAPETVFTVSDFKKIFYPVMQKDLIVNNLVVGIPLDVDGLVLVYNESMLKAAGFSSPPTSWDELLEMAEPSKGITVKDANGNILTSGAAIGTAENIVHFSDILTLMMLQNGVDFSNIGSDQNAVSVLDTYTNFSLSENKVWDGNMESSTNAFIHGKVAMTFCPLWAVENIKKANPDLTMKVTQVPQIKGGKKRNLASYWVEGVSKGSRYQTEAWEFLKYLSEKETLTKIYDLEVKGGRLFGMAYPRTDMADLLLTHEYIGPLIKDAQNLDSFPLVERTYDNGLNDKLIAYLKDAINSMVNGSTSSQTALQTLGEGFTQIYQQYSYTPKSL